MPGRLDEAALIDALDDLGHDRSATRRRDSAA